MPLNAQKQAFLDKARSIYVDRLRDELEPQHDGELIAVEPESGGYVLAKTFREIDLASQAQFGTKPVHIFRVGGGGAVKIGRRSSVT